MNREIADLREVITKLVPMLTGKGLKVTQRGSRAYVQANARTNKPEVVNIPSIPDNATSEFIAAIAGFIDHEVGHVLHTDWKFYGGDGIAVDKFSAEGRALTNAHNIVEDTFVEREMIKLFPGSRSNLQQLHEYFIERITKPALQQVKGDEKQEFGVLFVPMIRALSGQQIFQDFMDDGGHWNHPMINNINLALSKETLDLIKKARNTKETLQAAQEIHDILFNRPEEPEQQEEPEEPEVPPMPAPPAPQEPDEGESDGESQDKPEQEAGEGDGDGERDHSNSEPSDDEAEGDDEGQGGKGDQPDDEGQAEDETDGEDAGDGEGQDDAGMDSDERQGDGAAGSEGDQAGDEDDESSDAGGSGRAGKSAAEDDAEAGDEDGDAADDSASEGDEDGEAEGAGDDGDDADAGEPDEGTGGDGEPEDGDAGEADREDDGDEDDGEGADAWDDNERGEPNSGDDLNDQDDGQGYGGSAGKSMFDLDPSEFEPVDLSQAIQNEISEMAARSLDQSDYSVFTRDEDEIAIFDPEALGIPMRDDWVPRMEENVQGMVGKMQKDIERAMASQSHVIRTPGHKRGRLHAPSLHRLIQNDPRVFTQKEEAVSKDTAVTLLIDNSGSMRGQRLNVAMHASYALAQTLDRVSIPNEVMGFTTGDLSKAAIRAYQNDPMRHHFSRTDTIVMPIFKDFNERVTPVVKRRFAAQINAQVGTNTNVDGESLEYAALRLMKRREKRKVVLVMSDGQPVGTGTGFHLQQTVQKLGKMGVETVALGIQTDVVKNFYPRYLVLNAVADLPAVVMGELRRILMS